MKKSILFALLSFMFVVVSAQNWTQKSDFPGTERYAATGFEINGKFYMGTGYNGVTMMNDWWEYDPVIEQWTQKASFPGAARFAASAFSIENKGYVVFGSTTTGVYTFPTDFWEYDPLSNLWTQKANFPGQGRYTALALEIKGKGYAGTGWKQVNPAILNDWWEYDPVINSWTQKSNFAGGIRQSAMGVTINEKAYIGLGFNGTTTTTDFWEYNPLNDNWVQKANFVGQSRAAGGSFNLNDKGYFGSGASGNTFFNDFFVYDAVNNSWNSVNGFSPGRIHPVVFSIGSCTYLVSGKFGVDPFSTPATSQNTLKDFWEYCLTTDISEVNSPEFVVYPNPWTDKLIIEIRNLSADEIKIEILNVLGQRIDEIKNPINKSGLLNFEYENNILSDGIYILNIHSETFNRRVKIVKNEN